MRLRYALAAVAAAVLATGGTVAAVAAGGVSDVTFAGCLAGGKLSNVQVTRTPSCAATATPVQWAGQAAVSSSPAPSPTPTPTLSPSPSPSPSPTAPPGACVTSAANGSCGPYLDPQISGSNGYNTYVNNDVWNAAPAFGSQALTAASAHSWSVTAVAAAGNTAVLSYPDT